MKAIIAADAINFYHDPSLPFDIYTNSSDYEMHAWIMKKGYPVAYWSKRLNPAQMNYNTMEKEMLTITVFAI